MKMAFMKSALDIEIRETELRPLENGEIRIRVEACGICGTDVGAARVGVDDYHPFGHEVAGEILELGPGVDWLSVGDRVALESATACGRCANCRNCQQELCTDIISFFALGSLGMAEEMIAPAASAVPFDEITAAEACLSEPLGVAIDMHRLAEITVASHVVVSGPGPIGLLAMRLAEMSGAERIYVCGRSHSKMRLDMARQWGAQEIIEVDRIPLKEYGFEKPPNRFMVTSPPNSIPPLFEIAAKGAIFSYIGIGHDGEGPITFDADDFHFKKLQLRASFASPAMFTPLALHLLKPGQVKGGSLISHRFPLSEIKQAMATAMDTSGSLKVVVEPNK